MIKWFEKHSGLSLFFTLLIAILIYYVSSISFYSSGSGPQSSLKATAYHISIFFLFTFFLFISLVRRKNKNLIGLVIIVALTYGALDEMHQAYVPGRTSTIFDVMLDGVGILFAFMIYFISLEYRNLREKPSSTNTNL